MSQKTLNEDLNVLANSNLEITYLDGDLNIIQKLDDEPNDVGGLTSTELKAKFDEAGNIIKDYINETLIPEILASDATEKARAEAESGRETAEAERVAAEGERISAESARATAEAARVLAEDARAEAESGRETAEAARASAETARASAEKIRASNETTREVREDLRIQNESVRGKNESGRVSAENDRMYAEEARAAAEKEREFTMTQIVENSEDAANRAATAAAAIEDMTVSAETLKAGSDATVTVSRGDYDQFHIEFGIPKGADGKTIRGPEGPTGETGPANTLTIGTVSSGDEAAATITGESPNQILNLVLPKGDKGDKGDADPSLGLTGAAAGESPVVSAVDEDGTPTAWQSAKMAMADGSNVNRADGETWRTTLQCLPGVKIYGKADDDGNILAYTNAACTDPVTYLALMGLVETGNVLLVYDRKTYQCVGFRESPTVPGADTIAVFFRAEHTADEDGNLSLYTETAVLDIWPYLSGEAPAPITITTLTLGNTTIEDNDMADEMGGGTL